MRNDLKRIGSAWIKETENGTEYIEIAFNKEVRKGEKVKLFEMVKQSNNAPDYIVTKEA